MNHSRPRNGVDKPNGFGERVHHGRLGVTAPSGRYSVKVAIGMPVFNGQNYLRAALESLVAQTFGDFVVHVSDNASTDATPDICREFARRDPRVHYHPLPKNLGAIGNYERVYELGLAGEYFKWAAHDDVCAPRFLEACVKALDENPDAVLAYPRARFIDERGQFVRDYPVKLATDAPSPAARFAAVACAPHKSTHNLEIFGLMRRGATVALPQQGGFAASDRVFLARLAMYGRFVEVPEVLFLSRDHAEQSIKTLPEHLQRRRSRFSKLIGHGQLPPAEWFDPKYKGRITFPEWRLAWEYLKSVTYGDDVPLGERARATLTVLKRQFTHLNWARMARDFLMALDQLAARTVQAITTSPKTDEDMVNPPVLAPRDGEGWTSERVPDNRAA
jgi:glycosyltransferase involved in cell wall biosynthesis